MKRKYTWILVFLFATVYIHVSLVLFALLETEENKGWTNHQLAVRKDFRLIPGLGEPVCECNGWAAISFSKKRKNPGSDLALNFGSYDERVCSLVDKVSAHHADIQLYDVYQSMKIAYAQYIWTHTGWNERFEISYDSRQWDERNPLEVFVVLHSHNDHGWKSTYDRYYEEKTRGILRQMLSHLSQNPESKFCWTEVTYLKRWFSALNTDDQAAFLKILHNGQLEILSGGWVMPDEAVTHYSAILDQLTEGHLWLQREFNYTVRHGMAVDPFGHSPTVAYLLRRAGVSDVIIQRAHFALKKHLALKQQLEFNWHQHWDASGEFAMFTHLEPFLLYNIVYSCGPDINICCQFDFDHNKCWSWGKYQKPEPITDDNVATKAHALLDQFRKKSQLFSHNKLLVLHGDDFRFNSMAAWSKHVDNLRKLFRYMNDEMNDMHVKVKFATPGEYLQAVKFFTSPPAPTLTGDFFTYNDRGEQYWSGFYSSRPFLKAAIRRLQHYLRSAEILYSLALSSSAHTIHAREKKARTRFLEELQSHIHGGRETTALMQHHDAVTGTAAQSVAADYLQRIHTSNRALEKTLGQLISFLTVKGGTMDSLPSLTPIVTRPGNNQLLRTVVLPQLPRIITVYNSLTVDRVEVLRLRVPHMKVSVKEFHGRHHRLTCQVNPVMTTDMHFREDEFEVVFKAKLPPLSLVFFRVEEAQESDACVKANVSVRGVPRQHRFQTLFEMNSAGIGVDFAIENAAVRASFCQCSGLLQGVTTKKDLIPHQVQVNFVTYSTGSWVNPLRDKSGAYVFLPDGEAKELQCRQPASVVLRGPVASSVVTSLPLVTQTATLHHVAGTEGARVYIENTVNLNGQNNTELAMRLKTSIRNMDGTFFTDLNGFQMQKRKYQSRLFIQGNFYPMTSTAFLEDATSRVSLLSAQSHGVASLDPGWLEVILDRRLMQDDWRGLNEGLTDTLPTHSSFALLVEDLVTPHKKLHDIPTAFPSLLSHMTSDVLEHPSILFASPLGLTPPLIALDALKDSVFPCDYRLLNLRALDDGKSVLVTLHRVGITCQLIEVGCHLGKVKVVLNQLFLGHNVVGIEETNITGTQKKIIHLMSIDENKQQIWELDIPPMEIRTYKLTLQ